jgi:hypothetical protein
MRLLFAELDRRNPAMAQIAREIQLATERIWTPVQAPWYTDHGPHHSQRIAEIIEQILFGVPDFRGTVQLTAEELLVLIGACYLHDVGMQHTRTVAPLATVGELGESCAPVAHFYDTLVRRRHAHVIYERILNPDPREEGLAKLGLHRCPRHLRTAIAEVSLSHGKWGYLREIERKYSPARRGPVTLPLESRLLRHVRLSLLAALLQIGDVLDVSHERVNPRLMDWIYLPLVSRAHWQLSAYVASVTIDSRANVIVAYEVPPEIYRDRILARGVRDTVETGWIRRNAGEPFRHLRARFGLDLRLAPLRRDDYSWDNEVMNIRPRLPDEPPFDVGVLRWWRHELPILDEERRRLQAGTWPESSVFRAVVGALAAYAQVEYQRFPVDEIEDTDTAVARACGIPVEFAQHICQKLFEWKIIISREYQGREQRLPLPYRFAITTRLEHDSLRSPVSVWYWCHKIAGET